MTTDNRTNEPTPEQIEAAAQAVREVDARAGLIADVDLPMYRARAALEAAAGVAPQAESVPTSKYISPQLPSMIRNLWKSDPSENSVRTALKLAGDLIQELIDLRADSVQPSSTVDEAALIREAKAEALEEASLAYGSGQLSGIFLGRDDYPKAWLRARAAEYRKAVRDGAQESE